MIRYPVITVFLLAILLAGIVPTHAAGEVATLDPVQGLVQLRRGDADWQTVVEATPVREGDTIRTDGRGMAYLTFFEGAELQIRINSMVVVNRLSVEAGKPSDVSLTVLIGETQHRVARLVDAASRYEVYTPGAIIAVRGTEFWVSVTRQGETQVDCLDGEVKVSGIDPTGTITREVILQTRGSATVSSAGEIRSVSHIDAPQNEIPESPLAPASCGDGKCETGERDLCPLDCRRLAACGDGDCDRNGGEDVVTCLSDCVPLLTENLGENLHFYWGGMRCDIDPASRFLQSPVLMVWGIGCFDTAAQASEHPHPADYQLTIDGQPADMSSLRQTGPDIHAPDCPWGWSYELGPLALAPGGHTLTMTETATDTWIAESGGHEAGQVATLSCQVIVVAP